MCPVARRRWRVQWHRLRGGGLGRGRGGAALVHEVNAGRWKPRGGAAQLVAECVDGVRTVGPERCPDPVIARNECRVSLYRLRSGGEPVQPSSPARPHPPSVHSVSREAVVSSSSRVGTR